MSGKSATSQNGMPVYRKVEPRSFTDHKCVFVTGLLLTSPEPCLLVFTIGLPSCIPRFRIR